MNSYKPVRMKEAAEYLGISTNTLRNWCNQGRVKHDLSVAGQRIFDIKELKRFKNETLGISSSDEPSETVFYVRSAANDDVSIDAQIHQLESKYGAASHIYKDISSGTKDNRKELHEMLRDLSKENSKVATVCITNKNRLAKGGYRYLEEFLRHLGVNILSLESNYTKEPKEVVMQDFLTVSGEYAGVLHRLRGWSQKKELFQDALEEVEKHI